MASFDTIMRKYLRFGLVLTICCQPIQLLCRYLAENTMLTAYSEHMPVTILSVLEKATISAISFALLLLFKKINSIAIHMLVIIFSISIFEYLLYLRDFVMAYFTFIIIYIFGKDITTFSNIGIKLSFITPFTIYLYHFLRMYALFLTDVKFPFIKAFMILITFISCDLPNIYKQRGIMHLDYVHCKVIADFDNILNLIPYSAIILDNKNKLRFASKMFKSEFKDFTSILETIVRVQSDTNLDINSITYHITIQSLNSSVYGINTRLISICNVTDMIHKEKVIASENAKWMLANIANHQLRTPLCGIESMIDFALPIAKIKDQECFKYLEVAKISATGLRHIIDDCIMLFQNDEKSMKLEYNTFTLFNLIEKIKSIFEFEADTKRIVFDYQVLGENISILSDENKLRHILFTVLSNAFKYTAQGHVKFITEISKLDLQTAQLTFTISDTGSGISAVEKDNIFHTFSNPEFLKANQKASSGVSLFIAKKICNLMGGEIAFDSVLNVGTTFIISIKCELSHNCLSTITIPISTMKHNATVCPSKEKSVLIVDDNSTNLFVLASILNKLGYVPIEASNGKQAVDIYKSSQFKIVFMDLNMPVMNGMDSAKEMINYSLVHNCALPHIIIVSAQDEPASGYKQAGIHSWITKPISTKIIKQILDSVRLLN